jgi:putative ABC transport system permease protein
MAALSDFQHVTTLAARDLLHEILMALWAILGLAALVTPLLIMFGLKFGIVESMKTRLLGSAVNREIRPTDFRPYTREWLQELESRDDVEMVIPDTRLFAVEIKLVNSGARGAEPLSAVMRPTAPGDPLLTEWNQSVDSDFAAVLSTPVANALQVEVGESIEGIIGRRGGEERVFVDLKVAGVLPREAVDRDWIYVSLPLLVAAELYRATEDVPGLNAPGELPDPDAIDYSYGSFRAFARNIDDVASLVEWLEAREIPTRSEYRQIAQIQQLDRALGAVFLIVLLVALVGGAASLGANLFAGVMRKRHELSLMRLIGFPGPAIVLFPIVQALLLAVLGSAVALGTYALAEPLINWQLGSAGAGLFVNRLADGAPICVLLPQHYAAAAMTVTGICLIAASAGAVRAGNITPAEGIRRD